MRRPCLSKRRSRTCRHCAGAPAPGWQRTVCAATSRKMRVGAPYRLSSVGWPLSTSVCCGRRHQAQARRGAGLQLHVQVLRQHGRQRRVGLHQRRLAGLHRGGQAADHQLALRAEPPAAVHVVAAARARQARAVEAQHEGLAGHHQPVDRLAARPRCPTAASRRWPAGCAPAPGRRRGGSAWVCEAASAAWAGRPMARAASSGRERAMKDMDSPITSCGTSVSTR